MSKNIFQVLLVLLPLLFSGISFADYETTTSTIKKVYLYDNATDKWGIRIVLDNPGAICDEWYVKIDTKLRDQMFSLALAAKASSSRITLMRRNDSENLANEGKTVCSVHRIYFD
jgi:hypothetical protein